jgi:hypothetical protein
MRKVLSHGGNSASFDGDGRVRKIREFLFFQETSGFRIDVYVIDVVVVRFLCRRQFESASDEAAVREEHDPRRPGVFL